MRVTGEPGVDGEDLARPLDVDVVGPVHHDLGDLTVTQQRLQRPETQDLVGDLLGDAVSVSCRQRRVLRVDDGLQSLPDPQLQLALLEVRVVQLWTERVHERLMNTGLHPSERVAKAGSCGAFRRRALMPTR
jgi:hypothetical protein